MAIEKEIKTRFQHKHDTEENWNKASNFIPKAGELIVYDPDDVYHYARIKMGDGVTTVINLPFLIRAITTEEIDEICGASIYSANEVSF